MDILFKLTMGATVISIAITVITMIVIGGSMLMRFIPEGPPPKYILIELGISFIFLISNYIVLMIGILLNK